MFFPGKNIAFFSVKKSHVYYLNTLKVLQLNAPFFEAVTPLWPLALSPGLELCRGLEFSNPTAIPFPKHRLAICSKTNKLADSPGGHLGK